MIEGFREWCSGIVREVRALKVSRCQAKGCRRDATEYDPFLDWRSCTEHRM